ncbi:MAG: quinohemoprotein amine dehydrogenase maturation protein [Bryobacterales bacterium]|nr:quinohemoprotein amine dehydrogenase maturation protein [Bryobacterales bacterium]
MNRLQLGEFHRFHAQGADYLYLVPSAAVFALDPLAGAILDSLKAGPATMDSLRREMEATSFEQLIETVSELLNVRALRYEGAPAEPAIKQLPPETFPLSTLVLNVTNQCNLSCTYCYEYGEDKIVDTENGKQAKFMSEATARESVDLLLARSGKQAYLTFFGGETLLNFPVVRSTIAYARERFAAAGKRIEFSLTTNATLLREEIIEFLAGNDVGVTVSIDGPREMQDQFRVFHNGRGSYDVVEPKIRELLRRHRSRPIGARVTLTSQTLDIRRIFRHLTAEIGFQEVGFAPVTTAVNRLYSIGESGYDRMLDQFRELAYEWRDAMLEGRPHGFSNVRDTVEEIHKGVSKAYPCGAGLGLMGVSTEGEVGLCHRFAGSGEHRIGDVRTGIDTAAQREFLTRHHIDEKTDCSRCWARPLCSGGCYHEAHVRYGSTERANLHYCEWIRGWTGICLEVYAAVAGMMNERNPEEVEVEASAIA